MDRFKETGLLDSKQQISEYLHNASDYMLKKYLKAGMPVVILGGQWIAYKENIEEFFKKFTRRKVDSLPDDL